MKDIKTFYNIPAEVAEDVKSYGLELRRFLDGKVTAERFKPFRVARGIYSQRGQTSYMMRIKVPAGGLLPHQMKLISDLSKKYGNGIPHVTTRQDVQLHWLRIEDTLKAMEALVAAGLTTKGGGGNTVRNVTACVDAGVCKDEAFDVGPYAVALAEYMLVHPKAYTLPRKFKYSFSGCVADCSLSTINDVGFIAVKKEIDGKETEGFRVYTAGGMGAFSSVGALLEEFIPADQVVYVAEALLNLFDKNGNRRNKHKARLRFFADRVGFDELKRIYKEELDAARKAGIKSLVLRPTVTVKDRGEPSEGGDASGGFDAWFGLNTIEQARPGFYMAKLALPLGDISADDFTSLASLVEGLGEGTIRTTHDQNIVVRWLTKEELKGLYSWIFEKGLGEKGLGAGIVAGGAEDPVCCPGASTCNLGICLSKGMASALADRLKGSSLAMDELKDIDIKISGCPNSCGQHPIGAIGFFGAARGKKSRMAPHYNVLVGGRVEEGKTALGTECGFVPAKKIPELVVEFFGLYLDGRGDGEDFYAYLDRKGTEEMKSLVKKHGTLPAYDESPEFYKDWGREDFFSLAGLGPGECGVGVFDMIETDIDEAKGSLEAASKAASSGDDASADISKALVSAARALLITRGVEPTSDEEVFDGFEEHFASAALVDEKFKGLSTRAAMVGSGHLNDAGLKENVAFVEELVGVVTALYDSMDDAMVFPGEKLEAVEKTGPGEKPGEEESSAPSDGGDSDVLMDLRGVKCPINYVKAKIKMETMEVGKTLLLYLDDGEPIANVPKSLGNDGQEILRMEKTDEGYFELLVKKAV